MFSVMVGIGETYLPAFALAAGMGELAAGLIATVPLVAGALLQLVSPWAVRLLGSHRRWVVLCASCQAAAFLPLAVAASTGRVPTWLAFAMASVYWGAGMATGPAWNSWVATLVPGALRASYFARRTRLSQIGVLAGFVAGGLMLQRCAGSERLVPAFAVLFSIAAGCRFLSVGLLASQSEPVRPDGRHRHVPLGELLRGRTDGALLIYFFAVQMAAQIAGPYFTPFMLKQIHFSYWQYVLLIAASFATKALALPGLGRLAQRVGTRRLLWIGGLGIVPVSAMWLVSNTLGYLILVQVAAGLTWAAYELAMFLLFFEAIPDEDRTSVLTTYNVGNAVATALGALIGGVLLRTLGERPATYLTIFGLSSVARLAAMAALARVPATRGSATVPFATRILGLRPSAGTMDRPVLASMPPGALEAAPAEVGVS